MLIVKKRKGDFLRVENVLVEEPHPNSLAGLLLLEESYHEQEEKKDKMRDLQDYLDRRDAWLSTFPVLQCHYCGKGPLEKGERELRKAFINSKNPMLATIDHKVPVSAGIDPADTSNWLVACKNCNVKKADKPYETFIKEHDKSRD